MGTNSDRLLMLGTEDGLYRVKRQGGDYKADLVGLKGTSFIRFPVAVDRTEPRRMFVGSTRGGVYRSDDGGESWHPSNEGIVHRDIWCVIQHPTRTVIQRDGRIRRWAPIKEMSGKFLRVILLPDGETVHNAFFDRTFGHED